MIIYMTITGVRRRTLKQRIGGNRRIVLVDIENIVGGSAAVHDHVVWAKKTVEAPISLRPGDLVVVGVGPSGLVDVGTTWTGVRVVMGRGVDGADLALLDVLAENIADRFAEVVLVSGDGIFANEVATLAVQGVRTTVIAHADGLSRRLELAASAVAFLPGRPTLRTPPALAVGGAA